MTVQEQQQPLNSIKQLLNEYKDETQGKSAETEATKQFAKGIDNMPKE